MVGIQGAGVATTHLVLQARRAAGLVVTGVDGVTAVTHSATLSGAHHAGVQRHTRGRRDSAAVLLRQAAHRAFRARRTRHKTTTPIRNLAAIPHHTLVATGSGVRRLTGVNTTGVNTTAAVRAGVAAGSTVCVSRTGVARRVRVAQRGGAIGAPTQDKEHNAGTDIPQDPWALMHELPPRAGHYAWRPAVTTFSPSHTVRMDVARHQVRDVGAHAR